MHLLKLHCPDAVGLLARITGFIAASGGNLLDVSQYTDPVSRWFFTRLAFTGGLAEEHFVRFEEETRSLADSMQAVWTLRRSDRPVRTVILVSKKDHCLVDLLWRCRSRELNIELPLVLSNHDDARSLVEREGIRFEKIDFSSDKPGAFAQLATRLRAERAELVILARFMQILPGELCREFEGKGHQYPPFLSPRLRRCKSLPPRLRTGCEAHRRDLPLCHRGSRPRADHRAGSLTRGTLP